MKFFKKKKADKKTSFTEINELTIIGDMSTKAISPCRKFCSLSFRLVKNPAIIDSEVLHSKIMPFKIILMRILGLFHKKNDTYLLKAYPMFILILLWLNCLRFLTNFNFVYGEKEDLLSGEFLVKACLMINTAVFAINSTFIFMNQELKHRESSLCNELNFLIKYDHDYKNLIKVFAIKTTKIYLISLFFAIFQSCIIFTGLFIPKSDFNRKNISANSNIYLSPFHRYSWSYSNNTYKLIVWIINSLSFSQSFFSSAYFISHCKILCMLFESFNEKLKIHIIKRAENISENEFETFRIWHLKLVSAVKRMDICYNQYLGCSFLGSLSSIVIIVYLFTCWDKMETSIELKITFAFSILILLFSTGIQLFLVANINTQVKFLIFLKYRFNLSIFLIQGSCIIQHTFPH
jgi:hypothetical protein